MRLVKRGSKPPEVTYFKDIPLGEVFQATWSDTLPALYMVVEIQGERQAVHVASGGTARQFSRDHAVVAVHAELHWEQP